jgi:hypothetical protein
LDLQEGQGHRQISIWLTNALIRFLRIELIKPLSQIPDLHKGIMAPVLDPEFSKRVRKVFSRIYTLGPIMNEKTLSADDLATRDELSGKILNILFSQCKPLLKDLVVFFQKACKITDKEARKRLFMFRLGDLQHRSYVNYLTYMAMDDLKRERLFSD